MDLTMLTTQYTVYFDMGIYGTNSGDTTLLLTRHDQEYQRERRQHQRQGDLVRRPLADGPLDQLDHLVQKRLAGAGGDAGFGSCGCGGC